MSNTAWKKYYKPKYKVQQKNERSVLGLKPRIFLMVQSNSEYNKKKNKSKKKSSKFQRKFSSRRKPPTRCSVDASNVNPMFFFSFFMYICSCCCCYSIKTSCNCFWFCNCHEYFFLSNAWPFFLMTCLSVLCILGLETLQEKWPIPTDKNCHYK